MTAIRPRPSFPRPSPDLPRDAVGLPTATFPQPPIGGEGQRGKVNVGPPEGANSGEGGTLAATLAAPSRVLLCAGDRRRAAASPQHRAWNCASAEHFSDRNGHLTRTRAARRLQAQTAQRVRVLVSPELDRQQGAL